MVEYLPAPPPLGVPVHDQDEHWMRHALALAARSRLAQGDSDTDTPEP
mgnify:CR=1 FL=1